MKIFRLTGLIILMVTVFSFSKGQKNIIVLSKITLKDKIKGGWAGQAIGVTYGGPSEFQFQGTIMQDYTPIIWNDHYMKAYYDNGPGLYDDLYMDLTFVNVFEKYGLDAPVDSFANAFTHAGYELWHANQAARYNILNGIKAPQSGHWLHNPHADCIDFQIEADFAGLMAPGMPNTASDICNKIGHIMNSGDGYYGGVYVANMYSLAFVSNNIEFIVSEALKSIPEQSDFYKTIREVINNYKKDKTDWKKCWFDIEKKWTEDVGCPRGVFRPWNIDAKVNCAYVVIGLLYGNGDFNKSVDISTRCGQDSDCNPSTVGGILGTVIGYDKIPEFWKISLHEVEDINFKYTSISLNKAYDLSFSHALKVIEKNAGKVSANEVTIKKQSPLPVAFEKNFDGHFPKESKYLQVAITDSININFDGNGIVVSSIVSKNIKDNIDNSYIAKAEVYLDNKMLEAIAMPVETKTRKLEAFWKFNLPVSKHKLTIKWINPDNAISFKVTDALVYSDKPVKNLFQ